MTSCKQKRAVRGEFTDYDKMNINVVDCENPIKKLSGQFMKAIFFSSTFYESAIQLGDHHLAREFSKNGWKVAFISTPLSPFHVLSGINATLIDRFNNCLHFGHTYKYGKGELFSYVPFTFLPQKEYWLLKNGFVFNHWHQFIFPPLKFWLKKNGFENVDIIFLREPKQKNLIAGINYNKLIYRIADLDKAFTHFEKFNEAAERELIQNADHVIYTAHALKDYAAGMNPKDMCYLPNGVDLSNFLNKTTVKPQEYTRITGPKVVYVGSIKYWFDFDLLNYLTKTLPDVNFIIIGPLGKYTKYFHKRKNLLLLGARKNEDTPNYLHYANIGIIPFNRTQYPDLIDSVNPLKLYEYTACGLPVVSTFWKELETINPPAILCKSKTDFVDAINYYLNNRPNTKQQLAFAKQHDWSIRYTQLMDQIYKNENCYSE